MDRFQVVLWSDKPRQFVVYDFMRQYYLNGLTTMHRAHRLAGYLNRRQRRGMRIAA